MAEGNRRDKRRRRWGERLVVLIMMLFPLLVAGGFLAPGWIQLLALAQEVDSADRPPIVDHAGRFGRRPLLVPRDFSAGFIPELLDLDQLFLSGQYRLEVSPESLARVTSFPRSHGDVIAQDDVGQFVQEIVFDDALMQESLKQFAKLGTPNELMPLCGTLHAGNCVRDDDLTSESEVVIAIPEPATGALLALGLSLLAYRGRASRAGSRR